MKGRSGEMEGGRENEERGRGKERGRLNER